MSNCAAKRAFLRIQRLSKRFGRFTALDDVSFEVEEGEFVCFLGPSGCGKTTLLRAIAGLDIQSEGAIFQAGQDISALPPAERDFGIVFQSYALFPNLNIERNVAYGLHNLRKQRSQISARVQELLDLVGLSDQGKKFPAQLSGGQQQRVALARALATAPGLLLLDEPLSALDAKVRVRLRQEVKSLQERLKVTTIMVTHDQEEALSMADRIVVMNHGVIEQVGTPMDIYRHPASLFVADFIGEMNSLDAVAHGGGGLRAERADIQTSDKTFAAGARVTVIFRPEDIALSQRDVATSSANSFAASVMEREFLGPYWRVALDCPDLCAAPIIASVAVNAARDLGLKSGLELAISLPAERLHVFAADTP